MVREFECFGEGGARQPSIIGTYLDILLANFQERSLPFNHSLPDSVITPERKLDMSIIGGRCPGLVPPGLRGEIAQADFIERVVKGNDGEEREGKLLQVRHELQVKDDVQGVVPVRYYFIAHLYQAVTTVVVRPKLQVSLQDFTIMDYIILKNTGGPFRELSPALTDAWR